MLSQLIQGIPGDRLSPGGVAKGEPKPIQRLQPTLSQTSQGEGRAAMVEGCSG